MMEKETTLEDVQDRISELKAELGPLLNQKKILLAKRAAAEGCTCAFMVMDGDAVRVSNFYCLVHRR
jgi:hypothetical protein